MIVNANAVHENHEHVSLADLAPLQGLIDLREDEEMLPAQHDHPQHQQNEPEQQQVMSRRKREGQLQANALQTRMHVSNPENAHVETQRQRHENRQRQLPGGVVLQQKQCVTTSNSHM